MIVIEKKHTVMIHCFLSLAVCAATPRGSGAIESGPDRKSHCRVTSRYYARFTLAEPMPRLGSDVVGGNSGRNHPTSRRHTIHIGRMARNVSIRVGWYERVVQYCTTPWLVR